MSLYRSQFLRRIILPVLKRLNPGDIRIKHHYTGKKFTLHSFRHKGYWYHGANRERKTMEFFKRNIAPESTVFEVGGHIGYITNYFASIVGERGKIYVFEPGTNNLPYIRKNVQDLSQVALIEKAVSNQSGTVEFFLDDLTGQNNSIVEDYEQFQVNRKLAFVESKIAKVAVEAITLDEFIAEHGLKPDFIKIDIEGAELMALEGMENCLKTHRPQLMVEITNNVSEVCAFLHAANYQLFNEEGVPIDTSNRSIGNVFCIPCELEDKSRFFRT